MRFIMQAFLFIALLVHFKGMDIDLPPNNNIEFSIISGDPLGNFTVGLTDGEIGVTGPLDYEAMDPGLQGVFSLTVMAKDKGVPPLSSTTSVIITVEVNCHSIYLSKIITQVILFPI